VAFRIPLYVKFELLKVCGKESLRSSGSVCKRQGQTCVTSKFTRNGRLYGLQRNFRRKDLYLLLMIIILSKTNQVLFFTRNYFRRKDLYLLLMIIILSKTNQVLFFTRNYFRRKDLYLLLMIIILSKTNQVLFLHVIIFEGKIYICF